MGRKSPRAYEAAARGAIRAWAIAVCAVTLGPITTARGATLTASATLDAACDATGVTGSAVVEFRLQDDACLTNALENCVFRYTISYSGLSSNATAAHLHDDDAGCSGSTTVQTFTVESSASGFVNGSVTMDQADTLALFAEQLVFDIHTELNAGGEVASGVKKDPKKMPAVSQWGLLGLMLILLTAGTLVIARGRRRITA